MKLLQKLLALNIPTVEECLAIQKLQAEMKQSSPNTDEPDIESIQQHLQNSAMASINIYVLDDQNCKIGITWRTESENSKFAESFAKVLYNLNEGDMKVVMAQILLSQMQQTDKPAFINNIIKHWEALYEEDDDTPVVLPSEVLPQGQ